MKTKPYFVITLLAFFTLIVLPRSFAQGPLEQPSIRLVYFLPNDRPARPDRIEALRQLIKETQQFYADEMERHGFGRKTFRVETDRGGEPIVHRFNGRFNERHYYEPLTDFKVWEEFFQQVNDLQHVYLIAIDLSYESLNGGESGGLGGVTFRPSDGDRPSFSFGSAAVRHRDETSGEKVLGGSAMMPASGDIFYDTRGFLHPLRLITHELAHAFGLDHDFSDPDSAVGGRGFRFSECDTEWLSASRFFNSKAVSEDASGNIQLISAPIYSAEGIALRFEVTDADGLHQAQLLVPENGSWGPWKLIDCQALDGQTQRVEFVNAELAVAPVERVMLQFMDDLGNITWATFLIDIVSLLPPPKIVSIPDPNLKQAIRSELGLGSGDTLTDRAMKKLGSLNVDDRKITNIAGLEYATQLRELFMGRNQIKSYDRLAELPNLTTLYLWTNNISDLSVLPLLPKLELLDLNWNHIRDVSRLAGFTNLTTLMLRGNKISDVSPLTGLVNLEVLHLKGNPIQDTSVLASLTKLRDVDIDIHQRSVPATGTWLAVEQPPDLSAANFVIKPGAFAIFVHKNQPSVSQPAGFNTYWLRSVLGAADFPNLADFFQNGGRIELVSHPSLNPLPPNTREPQLGDVVISEIMWGLNGSAQGKQYIELYNASAHTYTFAHGDLMFRFSKASEEPLPEEIFAPPFNANARLKVIDKVSNKVWKVPGQSGNISQNRPLISMYRAIDYTIGNTPEGTFASSWKESTGRVNLSAPSYGTPGAAHLPPRPVVQVESTDHPPLYWIDTTSGTLHRLAGTEVENLAPSVRNAIGLAIDVAEGKLYWIERTSDKTGRIRQANLDGSNVELVKELTSVPHGIALDAAGGKIYLTNSWGKVQRLNVDGLNFQTNLITGLENLKDIAVDVVNHKVYWTEQTDENAGRVRRADLAGSNVELVKELNNVPHGIAVNPSNGKLYLTNSRGKVQRFNLDGSNFERNFIVDLNSPQGIAVDVAEGKIYWTEKTGIRRASLDGTNIQDVVTGSEFTNIVLGTPVVMDDMVTIASPPADINEDGRINVTDLLLVVTALQGSETANPRADVNADGTVTTADLLLVIENLDDPVNAAAPMSAETITSLDKAMLETQLNILLAQTDGSLRYQQAIAFLQTLLATTRPNKTRLLANYPNPFNPETWIPYQLADSSDVEILIYDTKGTVIRHLELGHQPAGYYTSRNRAAYWDGRNTLGERVASGLYFYQLQVDALSLLRKMLILK